MVGWVDDPLAQSGFQRQEIEVAYGYYTRSDTDTDDEDARYYLHPVPLHDHRQPKMVTLAWPGPVPVLDQVGGRGSAGSRSRSTTRASSPTSSLGSDGAISDADAGGQAIPKEEKKKVSALVNAVDKVGNSVSVSKAIDDPTPVKVATSDQVIPGSGSSSSASVESSRQHAADLSMAIVLAEAAPPAAASNKGDIAPTPPAPEHKEVPCPLGSHRHSGMSPSPHLIPSMGRCASSSIRTRPTSVDTRARSATSGSGHTSGWADTSPATRTGGSRPPLQQP
ncbi:hypothetical protein ZWY2020_026918 [Hordeum vulgare]|nr:hypothetical protein ZWY2020_026918 [Hordeum vulgare]